MYGAHSSASLQPVTVALVNEMLCKVIAYSIKATIQIRRNYLIRYPPRFAGEVNNQLSTVLFQIITAFKLITSPVP